MTPRSLTREMTAVADPHPRRRRRRESDRRFAGSRSSYKSRSIYTRRRRDATVVRGITRSSKIPTNARRRPRAASSDTILCAFYIVRCPGRRARASETISDALEPDGRDRVKVTFTRLPSSSGLPPAARVGFRWRAPAEPSPPPIPLSSHRTTIMSTGCLPPCRL